jgi:hypothetical protein
VSLVLAIAVLVTTSPAVLMAIAGFAVLFGLFDLLEVIHQVERGQTALVAIALVLLATHVAIVLIALRLLGQQRTARPSVA